MAVVGTNPCQRPVCRMGFSEGPTRAQNKGDALRAERAIKGLPRAKKVQLIDQAKNEGAFISVCDLFSDQ